MPYSSRRAYTDTSDSGHATYADYQDSPCRPLRYREYETRQKVTVTREYTAYGSHRFSSGYHRLPDEGYRDPTRRPRGEFGKREASSKHKGAEYTYSGSPKQEFGRRSAQRDNRHGQSDRPYSSDDDTMPEKRNARGSPSSAEEWQGHTSDTFAEHSQQEGLKPVPEGSYSGIPRSHGSNKYGRSDNHSQNKLNNSTSRHGEKHCNSRSDTRRQEYSRSNRNDPYYEDCEQRYHRRGPKPSQPQEPKPDSRDGYSSKTEGYFHHKSATKDKPGQGKPESGSSRRQEKHHSSRSESRRERIPRNDRESSSHEIPQSQPKAKDNLPDHYDTLKIDYLATKGEIKSAAKRRRVEVHPDKLMKPGMSDSERDRIHEIAVMVGHAADLLQDPEQKLRYDPLVQYTLTRTVLSAPYLATRNVTSNSNSIFRQVSAPITLHPLNTTYRVKDFGIEYHVPNTLTTLYFRFGFPYKGPGVRSTIISVRAYCEQQLEEGGDGPLPRNEDPFHEDLGYGAAINLVSTRPDHRLTWGVLHSGMDGL